MSDDVRYVVAPTPVPAVDPDSGSPIVRLDTNGAAVPDRPWSLRRLIVAVCLNYPEFIQGHENVRQRRDIERAMVEGAPVWKIPGPLWRKVRDRLEHKETMWPPNIAPQLLDLADAWLNATTKPPEGVEVQ